MTQFDFSFHGNKFTGNFLFSNKGSGWIKVIFQDHSAEIFPTTFQTKENKCIWVQHVRPAEAVWPHELIQAMGECVEMTLRQNQPALNSRI